MTDMTDVQEWIDGLLTGDPEISEISFSPMDEETREITVVKNQRENSFTFVLPPETIRDRIEKFIETWKWKLWEIRQILGDKE